MQIIAQSQPVLLADLTWPEVRDRARPGAVVLLPLAAAGGHATEGLQLMGDIHASVASPVPSPGDRGAMRQT